MLLKPSHESSSNKGIPKIAALRSPSLERIFIISSLLCMFTICSRKSTGKKYYCHCLKSWGIKKRGSWGHLCCFWSVVSHRGIAFGPGKQPHCLLKHRHGSELWLLHELQMLFALGIAPQSGCNCVLSPHTGIFLYNSKLNLIFT